MSILNRRNAFLGWIVWETTKRVAQRKAQQALDAQTAKSKKGSGSSKKRRAFVATAAAAAGALVFWRRRSAGPDTFGE
jgi:hypothetical protein